MRLLGHVPRRLIYLVLALPLAVAFVVSTPAKATDARTAIRLCEKNPNCKYSVRDNGSVDITLGDNIIVCPQEGECECYCTHPEKKQVGNQELRGDVAGVLSVSPGRITTRVTPGTLKNSGAAAQ